MFKVFRILRNLKKDERGATAIEYGLIAALVSIAAIGAMGAVGTELNNSFTQVRDNLVTGNGKSVDAT